MGSASYKSLWHYQFPIADTLSSFVIERGGFQKQLKGVKTVLLTMFDGPANHTPICYIHDNIFKETWETLFEFALK